MLLVHTRASKQAPTLDLRPRLVLQRTRKSILVATALIGASTPSSSLSMEDCCGLPVIAYQLSVALQTAKPNKQVTQNTRQHIERAGQPLSRRHAYHMNAHTISIVCMPRT